MRKLLIFILFLSFNSAFAIQASLQSNLSPIGYWKTIDDVTGRPRSIMQIQPGPNQTLTGRIIKTFAQPGKNAPSLCKACKGSRQNQPLIGMVIMDKLIYDKENRWKDGEILDPASGKTYHCNIQVIDNGNKINIRGYVGLPLFGRTQTWIRASKP